MCLLDVSNHSETFDTAFAKSMCDPKLDLLRHLPKNGSTENKNSETIYVRWSFIELISFAGRLVEPFLCKSSYKLVRNQ